MGRIYEVKVGGWLRTFCEASLPKNKGMLWHPFFVSPKLLEAS
jgi:hypothetical protein